MTGGGAPLTKESSGAGMVATLKVTLLYLEPVIWRRVEVESEMTLAKLHRVIQAAMGWENAHLHLFERGKQVYGVPNSDFGLRTEDERKVTVAEVFPKKGAKLKYVYDLGDDWVHEVKLEKLSPPGVGGVTPKLIDGARACPPEDCGGAPGFVDLLNALADPGHEQREEMLSWVGGSYDPAAFDLKSAARAVSKVR